MNSGLALWLSSSPSTRRSDLGHWSSGSDEMLLGDPLPRPPLLHPLLELGSLLIK
jgi:hypothetical protein